MKTIYKYNISSTQNTLILRKGAQILSVGYQGLRMMLWAVVDTDAPQQNREVLVLGTGWNTDLQEHHKFIGTLQDNVGFVWHVFDGGEV